MELAFVSLNYYSGQKIIEPLRDSKQGINLLKVQT